VGLPHLVCQAALYVLAGTSARTLRMMNLLAGSAASTISNIAGAPGQQCP
jgi:hypothetical protein